MPDVLRSCRVVTAYTEVHVGDPKANVDAMIQTLNDLFQNAVWPDVVAFPELSITGYTCADLFNQTVLLNAAKKELLRLAEQVDDYTVVVGIPLAVGHTLYNCAAVINNKKIVGIIPKTFLPNYKEFYERRWFAPAPKEMDYGADNLVLIGDQKVPFGTDLLFQNIHDQDCKIGVEICEDLWAPIPPSSYQAIAGATLLLNLSASNETVGKADYRRSLVENQSARLVAAYAYCSAGPTESTADVVFGGHCIIAENGTILKETQRFKDKDYIIADIDLEKLVNERRRTPTFNDSKQNLSKFIRTIPLDMGRLRFAKNTLRVENRFPFVPNDKNTLDQRCKDIFDIQVHSLMKRMQRVSGGRFTIGVSGGLDSTLALLVAVKACKKLGLPTSCIDAVTMPGFGTSAHTHDNANKLMDLLQVSQTTIDIRQLCLDAFREIGHKPFGIEIETNGVPVDLEWFQEQLRNLPAGSKDVVFENVQARIRTMLLMSRGFVLGTGDMSELAIGFCTYNGDHMSMFNVNCSVPKTLVKFLVNWVAEYEYIQSEMLISNVLKSIVETEISPELLPLGKNGEIVHSTETIVGPYMLIDFFMFQLVRNCFSPKKILILTTLTFPEFTPQQLKSWLKDFLMRFFKAQFKRDCVPNGPKAGSVSLSPRGDLRMPSDAEDDLWLQNLEGGDDD